VVFHGNVPDEIWNRLKQWAKSQAGEQVSPTIDECVSRVLDVAAEVAGRPDSLRRDVVSFYAAETAEMIAKFRDDDGIAGTTGLEPAL
jgi:hypothetical protein